MRRRKAWTSVLLAGISLLVNSSNASTQLVATSFDELHTLVQPGEPIEVTHANGRKMRGRLGELSTSSLELLVRETGPDGRETFVPKATLFARDVRQVRLEHRDSVLNGTLIGAAIGAGPFLLVGAMAAAQGGGSCGSDSNVCPAVAAFTGPIGAGIAALIDASIRQRTTVYYQPADQEIPTSFDDLRHLMESGDTVYVTDRSGATMKGKLTALSAASLGVQIQRDGAARSLTLSAQDVDNIVVQRADSLWNGMLIGFGIGSIPVALIGAGASAAAAEVTVVAAGYGAIGLLTGLLIDSLNKERTTIYVHTPRQRSSDVRVYPLLSKSAASVRISVRF